MQVDFGRMLDRGPRLWERPSGRATLHQKAKRYEVAYGRGGATTK
jgi:hypothetical protein